MTTSQANDLFDNETTTHGTSNTTTDRRKMREELPRLDSNPGIRESLLPYCRLAHGDVWVDPIYGHRVGVLDSTKNTEIANLLGNTKPTLAVNDPPYNVVVGAKKTDALFQKTQAEYDIFSDYWTDAVISNMAQDASFYVWLGADYKNGFHPVPEFCIMMRNKSGWNSRNWITLRNQRGYGTQKNWMWLRQELLYYTKGNPVFQVDAEYTDIPKTLKGYYKYIDGNRTENTQRGKSDTIRAGNVWHDLQQVFYRLHENVPGCYAQKPLKAIERIVAASSKEGDPVIDVFSHSGTTLISGERLGRQVFTADIDPVYAEITIRRLEHYRRTGEVGWQCESPFSESL